MELEADLTPDFTISKNWDAILNSFQFSLRTTIRNFFFYHKKIKSKQDSSAITTPAAGLPIGVKVKYYA